MFEPLEPRLVLDAGPLLISEFLASNDSVLADADGDYSDWIEIHNSSGTAVSLERWYLTDNEDDLTKWQFPAVSIDPDDYLVVFASGKDRTQGPELHTSFKLDADGESVALVMPDGQTVAHAYWDFPRQLEDISYGLPDSTTIWETLVGSVAPTSYHVPTPGEDVLGWTAQDYDDSGWADTVSLDPAGLVVTEIEAGEIDWLEIQNVSDQAINTSGWLVAANDTSAGSIHDVHGQVWNLPASIAPGEVLYRTDDPADNYWGSDIAWESGSGWVMILDGGGEIADFTAWGYNESEIASLDVSVGGFSNVTVGDQWHGAGVPGGAGQVELVNIEHTWAYEQSDTDLGTPWREVGYDDSAWPAGAALLYVEGSALPAPKNTPLTLGPLTYYFRTHFTLDAHPGSVTQLDLNTVIDDGAVVYLNGVEVYRLGVPAGAISHFTEADRTVGNAVFEGPFTISPDALVAGDNVLAVEVHQTNPGSSDIVMGLQLEAAVLEPALERIGNSDVNVPSDFDLPAAPSKGVQNPGLTVPFVAGTIPALTGVGFSDDADFDEEIRTDVAQAMRDVNASLWSRIEFPVGDASQFDVLTLRMKYDDGFVAYLNGTEVARRNAPDPLAFDSAATAARPDEQAVVFEDIDISDDLHLLRQLETNVLAIHGLNVGAADEDFLILPELIATSNLEGPQYMTTPTPWQDNVAGALGLVKDTQFSVDRGFYEEPFEVEITTDTIAAEIRYTLEGSTPTGTTGTVYTGPIAVNTTTTLRAAAFKPGYIPTNVDTQTYIFFGDVIYQPSAPPGFPASWGDTTADYEMDPDVVNDPLYSGRMIDSLSSLPTMSIVTDKDNLFGASGIYDNPGGQGAAWERPTSVEWINPDGTTGFQVNAGLRIYGGAFRGMGLTRKKTFRLLFKDEYGPTKLEFPLFDAEDAATRFDTIILRGGANDGWNNWGAGNTQYIIDEYMRRLQLDLGGASGHGTFAHLYVNGLYWGLYNPVERPEASFSATYYGGEKEEWDALNSGAPTGESNTGTWNAMLTQVRAGLSDMDSYQRIQGNNPDGTDNPAYDDLLDVENYIAYMFSNFWGGTGDWPGHNWYAACRRPPNATGFKFYNWDSEGAIVVWSNLNANTTGVGSSAAEPYAVLKANDEFNLLFGDHVQQHLLHGGVATSEASYARYRELADEVELAIISESARWGDQARATPYTLVDWQATRDYVLNTYMPQRPAIVLGQLRDAGLYPEIDAPTLSQHGGQVDPGFGLTMTVTAQPVYEDSVVLPEFTGSRYFVPTDNNLGTTWTEWGFDDASWGTGDTGLGYENSPADYQNLINTHVRPQDADPACTSIFLRIPFTVDDPGGIDRLLLRMKYEDGYVAYINGQEVARRNIGGTPGWNSTASNRSDSAAVRFEDVDISAHIGRLVQGGNNVLAIHALNSSTTSSDLLILPEVMVGTLLPGADPEIYYTTDGSDPRLFDGGVSDSAVLYGETPVTPTESGPIKSRTLQNGKWSALDVAEFIVGVPATAENLVVTELNYNPYPPTPAELAIDDTFQNDDFEFVELQNVGGETIELFGLEFTKGIEFDFRGKSVTRLAANESVVVAANPVAFQVRYGTEVNLAGGYSLALGNGGDQITLRDWFGRPIVAFAYDDGGGWPGRANGKGASLELIDPAGVPTTEPERTDYLQDDENWRSSSEYGGSPGFAGTGPLDGVAVNEVLTHTDPPDLDTIELYNTTDGPIDVGGWYLSDSWGWDPTGVAGNYKKFRIPDGTGIPAHGYLVFDEDDFDFALSGVHGDDVWLMEADAGGKLTRFVDHVEFGAAPSGESWGRWPNGEGDLYPMISPTLDKDHPENGLNSGPRLGEVIISEIHYNPDLTTEDDDLEFIEIYNDTGEMVGLTDWRIRKGIDYNFPDDTLLAPYSALVVVPFELDDVDKLTAFYAEYWPGGPVPEDLVILGGYGGRLNDEGERVQLQRPDEEPEDEPGFIPHPLEDEVRYDDEQPWPTNADGGGDSLHRVETDAWGNTYLSWNPLPPTPGRTLFVPAGAEVVGRHVFYNHSVFDGNHTAANAQDDGAIAPDKAALLPGETASFANYTSYSAGINGIMVDVDELPAGAIADQDDFQFRVGNVSDLGIWRAAPPPAEIAIRRGQGAGGSARITIVWPDNSIQKKWLQVTVLATANNRLAEDDVFYFGNAVGETGNSTTDAKINAFDMLGARDNQRTFLSPAPIDFAYDFNRDARVNTYDMLIARDNQTHFLNALRLITAPMVGQGTCPTIGRAGKAAGQYAAEAGNGSVHEAVFSEAAGRESRPSAASLGRFDWLSEFEETHTHRRPAEEDNLAEQAVDGLLSPSRWLLAGYD